MQNHSLKEYFTKNVSLAFPAVVSVERWLQKVFSSFLCGGWQLWSAPTYCISNGLQWMKCIYLFIGKVRTGWTIFAVMLGYHWSPLSLLFLVKDSAVNFSEPPFKPQLFHTQKKYFWQSRLFPFHKKYHTVNKLKEPLFVIRGPWACYTSGI